jgi:hypothetical protein
MSNGFTYVGKMHGIRRGDEHRIHIGTSAELGCRGKGVLDTELAS